MVVPSPGSSDEPFEIGSVLDGRYRIDGVLGTGGMGRVYRAEHTKIGRSVAIKVLHADLGRNRDAVQRFQREAIASGRLDHPNIVSVLDFGALDSGACYLVMEVLEGESLGDRLAREKRIHWTSAIDILRGVLIGLRHAHERGVVHRDIKPDNIYLAHKDGEPVIKILDFGIAKLYAGTEDDPASTRAGLTVGTPAYLSPEQAVGGAITPASDLYSATVVLYEMLAGRAPFEDKDPLAMLGAHVSRKPPRFAVIAPDVDVPPALESIIQHGLVKTAADRIGSAADYLAALDSFAPPTQRTVRPKLDPTVPDDRAPISMQWRMPVSDERRTPVPSTPVPSERRTPVPSERRTPVPSERRTPVPSERRTPAPGRTPAPATQAFDTDAARAAAATGSALAAAIGRARTESAASSDALVGHPSLAAALSPAPRAVLPRPAQPVALPMSLGDVGDPIPLSWIVRSGAVVGLAILAAIILSIVSHCTSAPPNAPPAPQPPPTNRARARALLIPDSMPVEYLQSHST